MFESVKCPICGYEYKESWEIFLDVDQLEFDEEVVTCMNCGQDFYVQRRVEFSYESYV